MEQIQTSQNPLGHKSIPSLLTTFAIPSIMLRWSAPFTISSTRSSSDRASAIWEMPPQMFLIHLHDLPCSLSADRYRKRLPLLVKSWRRRRRKSMPGRWKRRLHDDPFWPRLCSTDRTLSLSYAERFWSYCRESAYAASYSRIIALGMPFQIITTGMSSLIRADGSPRYSMTCMLIGAILNTILDPIFIFVFQLGVAGAAWATIIGQFFSFLAAILYLRKFQSVRLRREHFRCA